MPPRLSVDEIRRLKARGVVDVGVTGYAIGDHRGAWKYQPWDQEPEDEVPKRRHARTGA